MQFPCLFLVSKYDFGRKRCQLKMRSWPWKGSKMRTQPSDQGEWKSQGQNFQGPPFWEDRRENGGTERNPKSWARRAGECITPSIKTHQQPIGQRLQRGIQEWKIRKLNPTAQTSLLLGIYLCKVQGLKGQRWWQRKKLVICDPWCCHFYSWKVGKDSGGNNNPGCLLCTVTTSTLIQ